MLLSKFTVLIELIYNVKSHTCLLLLLLLFAAQTYHCWTPFLSGIRLMMLLMIYHFIQYHCIAPLTMENIRVERQVSSQNTEGQNPGKI